MRSTRYRGPPAPPVNNNEKRKRGVRREVSDWQCEREKKGDRDEGGCVNMGDERELRLRES